MAVAFSVLIATPALPATILGTVRDASTRTPLPGVVIFLDAEGRSTTTDADGRYVLDRVPEGENLITVRLLGYAEHSLEAFVPPAGELEINVSLRAEPIRMKTVDVWAPIAVRGIDTKSDRAFPDRGSSIAQVRSHPLLAEPDFFQVLSGGEVVVKPESPSGIHIRGGASDHTAYLLDGIPVFSPYHAAGVFSAWNPDALSRLDLISTGLFAAHPHALCGAVEAVTRDPGREIRIQGTTSTTQARLTMDGPLGNDGAGYLTSFRTDYPDAFAPGENSYVKGNTGDRLAKLVIPAFRGRLRLLGYDNRNELSTVDVPEGLALPDSRRNSFRWKSRSLGAEWIRELKGVDVRVLGWTAGSDAHSAWSGETARIGMDAQRRDQGLLATVKLGGAGAVTSFGLRFEQSWTAYAVDSDSVGGPYLRLNARTPVADLFAHRVTPLGTRGELKAGATLTRSGGSIHVSPHAQVNWKLSVPTTLTGSYVRTHQFAQSLRNAESIVGQVFPVDLYIGAGAPEVPVARNDQGVVGLKFEPSEAVRLGAQVYLRRSEGLLLVAPVEGEPFTTGDVGVGSGTSRGFSLNAAVSTARFGIIAGYGAQRVRLDHGGLSYTPDYGAAHLFEGGITVTPSSSTSVRIGAVAALGRRSTIIPDGFEWEACNLADQGCEFGGSPHYGSEPLGGASVPGYFRVDVGLRKSWTFKVEGRSATLALFGTVTNLLNRRNLLTYARNPDSGELVGIEMRPLSPLVIGLDWRF